MKQTSLIQSWTRALNPTIYQNRSPANLSAANSTLQHPAPSTSNTTVTKDTGADTDDQLLANCLDQYIDDLDANPVVNNQTAIAALRSRPPIAYRPTGNDSDRLSGFDTEAGRTWIYPLNVSIRDYQFHITEQCLYKNTLVCLPTGLGKTFVAAVVMYNFLRWYPQGKSVFMAPTRPLVAQQLTACRRLLGLSSDTVIELTGSTPQPKRQRLWTTLRAFFLTPQVLMNDLQAGVCPSADLRLLVFDEAHKATGNHAYCQVIRLLTAPPHNQRLFRVVALSATPASDIQGVQTVLANLLISHLELRTDTSADVKRYTQHRQLETVVVPLGPELNRFRNQLIECARIPLERLRLRGALRQGMGDLRPERIAKYTVIKAREEWSSGPNAAQLSSIDAGAVQCDFGSVICLLHAMELLDQHGLRPLYQYFAGVFNGQRASPTVRAEMMRLSGVNQLWSDLVTRFQPAPGDNGLSSTQVPFVGGHPKLEKLKELLVQHFRSHPSTAHAETRVIVFSQFRDSVEEIMHMLKQLRPLIKPASFIGQGSGTNRSPVLVGSGPDQKPNTPCLLPANITSSGGISQRDQLRIMDAFRAGVYNTLVSTCVGEEGLDVGQVDLIICFDAFKSPVRLMQRLGRTGRQRLGRIVMLLTEGREERNHAVSMSRTSTIHRALLEGGAYKKLAFYPHNPRMIPLGITPEVEFRVLEAEPVPAKVNLLSRSAEPDSRKRPPRARQKNRMSEKTSNEIQSHADAIGLSHINMRLTPVGPSPLLSPLAKKSPHSALELEHPPLTQLYNVTSPRRLNSLRMCLQSNLSPNRKAGSSTSSRHLVSVLHLIELHRRGVTQLSFHALGLRSVDVDKTLPTPTGDAELEPNQEEPVVTKIEKLNDANHTSHDQNPQQQSLTIVPLKMPMLIKGLVSEQLFFTPTHDGPIDPQLVSVARCLMESSKDELKDRITPSLLQSAWDKLMKGDQTQAPEEVASKVSKSQEIPSVLGLEQWIDKSLLEAIEGEFTQDEAVVDKRDSAPAANLARENIPSIPVPPAKPAQTGLAAAFCLASPKQLNLSVVARSTPQPKSPLERSDTRVGTSQINLTDALAILDRSTIRLNISGLFDDELDEHPPPAAASSDTFQRSAVFTGPVCPTPSKFDTLSFGTKLQLGEEFGDDFLAPTQPVSLSTNPELIAQSHSTPQASPKETDPFDLSSQFSWSPVPVQEDEQSRDGKQACSKTVPLKQSSAVSPYSRSTSGNSNAIHQKTTILHQNQTDTNGDINTSVFVTHRSRKRNRARHFLLTQAEVDEDNSADEFESPGLDMYDESFIDDNHHTLESDEGSSSRLNHSNMMGVYLQSIRSPPILGVKSYRRGESELPRKHLATAFRTASVNGRQRGTERQPWSRTRLATIDSDSEDFIFSQAPEQDDDYEIDSFCVNSEDPGTQHSPVELSRLEQKPKRRRRRIITDSD